MPTLRFGKVWQVIRHFVSHDRWLWFFLGRLRVPTRRCDLVVPADWGWGHSNKPKARLCAHGGMQTWGQNYWETYAPVVNWASVRLTLAIEKIHGLSLKSINFVLAFPHADLEIPV